MIIPCELLINIFEKVIPKIKNHYGCMAYDCRNRLCAFDFYAIVDQTLKLKGVNNQWKTVLEKFVIKKHLKQLLYVHEQTMTYLPNLRFVLHKSGNEPFNVGLHPFQSENVLLLL